MRAVRAGHDPVGPGRTDDTIVATYCNDTIVRAPPAENPAMDRQLMRETGRRLADGCIKDPPLLADALGRTRR